MSIQQDKTCYEDIGAGILRKGFNLMQQAMKVPKLICRRSGLRLFLLSQFNNIEVQMHVSTKPIGEYPWYIRLFFWNQSAAMARFWNPACCGAALLVFSTLALLYGALDRKSSPYLQY